jgi:hypothetical protein
MEGDIEIFDNKKENNGGNNKRKNVIIIFILIITVCTFAYVFRWSFLGLGYMSIVKLGTLNEKAELKKIGENIDQTVQEINFSEIDLSKINFFTIQNTLHGPNIYSYGQNKDIDSLKLSDDMKVKFPECFDKNSSQKLRCSTKIGTDYIIENSYGDRMQSKIIKKDRSFERDIIFPMKIQIYSCALLGNEGALCQVFDANSNNTFFTYNVKKDSLDVIGENISGAFGLNNVNADNHMIHPKKPYAINIGCLKNGIPESGDFVTECKRMGVKLEGINMMKEILAVNTTESFDIGWDDNDFYIKQYGSSKVSNVNKLYRIKLP